MVYDVLINKGVMITEQLLSKGSCLYLPEGPGPFPLICQTPLLGRLQFLEDLFFEKRIAAYFARKGFACAILHRPIFEYNPNADLTQLALHIETSIQNNQTTLEEILKNPKIDSTRIGTFGMSFGSIINSLWAARNSQLKAHVFALPGADIAEIFMTSQDPLMRSYQKDAVKYSGLKENELLNKLKTIFKQDPLHFAGEISSGSCLIILAIFDRVVRFNLGLKFKKSLGNPKTLYLPLGHYTSILAIPFLRYAAAKFFTRKFSSVPCIS